MPTQASIWSALGAPQGIRTAFALISIVSVFINLLVLTSPIYMLQVYDRVVGTGKVETLGFLSLMALVALTTMGILDAIRGRLLVRLGRYLELTLRDPILKASISRVHLDSPGRPLDDFSVMRNYIASPAVLPFLDLPWTPFFILLMALLHSWLGLLALGAAALLFLLTVFNDRLSKKLVRDASLMQGSANEFAANAITNSDAVRAMGMQSEVGLQYARLVEGAALAGQRAAEIAATSTAASRAIRIAVQSAALGLGAFLVLKAELTPGGMIAGSILLGRALAPIEQGIGSWRQFLAAREAYRSVKEFLSAVPAERQSIQLPEVTGKLVVDIQSFLVAGRVDPILSGIKFEADPGTVIGIVGASASGKSSLCRLLVGAAIPHAGVIRIDGANVASLADADRHSAIGFLPQTVELFRGTVASNIARLGAIDETAVVAAAQLAGCHSRILKLQQGYATEVGPRGAFLSGGQRQQIGLARALYRTPRLLVLDEPNANLDQEGEAALLAAIVEAKCRNMVVIVVSHRSTLLAPIDRILVLQDGTIDRFGDRDEVLRQLAAKGPRPTLAKSKVAMGAQVG